MSVCFESEASVSSCDPGVTCLHSFRAHHLRCDALRPRFFRRRAPHHRRDPLRVRLQDRAPTNACDRELWLQLHPETEAEQSVASLNCVTGHAGACPTLKPAPRPAGTEFSTLLSWSVVVLGLRPASLANEAGPARPASAASPTNPTHPAGSGRVRPVRPVCLVQQVRQLQGSTQAPSCPEGPAMSCESNRSCKCGRSRESTTNIDNNAYSFFFPKIVQHEKCFSQMQCVAKIILLVQFVRFVWFPWIFLFVRVYPVAFAGTVVPGGPVSLACPVGPIGLGGPVCL